MAPPRPVRRSAVRRARVAWLPLPGQALSLAALVTVLVAVLSSVPLLLGAAEEGAWDLARDRAGEEALGTTLLSAAGPDDVSQVTDDVAFTPFGPLSRAADLDAEVTAASVAAGTGDPLTAVTLRRPLLALTADGATVRVQLLARDGADRRVELLAGDADGVLLPAGLATATGLEPGDELLLQTGSGRPAALPVDGVYADLAEPLPAWWGPLRRVLLPQPDPNPQVEDLPSAVVVVPQDLLAETAQTVLQDVFVEWVSPLPPGIDVDAARAWAAAVARLGLDLSAASSPVARAVSTDGFPRPRPESGVVAALAVVDDTVDRLSGPVRAVGSTGGVAVVALVGAWAAQRLRRREDEIASQVTRGLSPSRGAGRAVREAVLPVLTGAGAGLLVARGLVAALGPAADLPADVGPEVARAAGLGVAGALVIVALVTAGVVARTGSLTPGTVAALAGRVPWLPVLAAVTVVTALPVLTGSRSGDRVDLVTLALPLLAAAVLAGTVTAVLPWVGRRSAGWLRRAPVGTRLVLRRVLHAPASTRLVVVTTAVSVGLVLYAGALADSTAEAVERTAVVATPADVVVPLVRRASEPGPLPAGSTVVRREEGVDLLPGGPTADVLAVQPDELAGLVRWDPGLADRPLAELLTALEGSDDDRVPVLVSGPVPDGDAVAEGRELEVAYGSYYSFPARVVARVDAFPGQSSTRPLVVAAVDAVTAAVTAAGRDPAGVLDEELWAPGETAAVLSALTGAGYGYAVDAVDPGRAVVSGPEVVASGWALGYLRAVAAGAGLLGLLGLVGHAAAQQRRRTVAALLLSRAGMTRRAADRTAAAEVALVAGLAAVVAVVAALPAAALVLPALDPVPSLPPGADLRAPWPTVAAVAAGLVLAALTAAATVGRRARSAGAGQVLRDAG